MNKQVKFVSGINFLLGLWLVASPFVLGYAAANAAAMWDAVIVGVLALILAAIRVANPGAGSWPSWANVVLGLWLVLAPFVMGTSSSGAAMWNDMIVGAGLVAFGTWSASVTVAGTG